MKLFPRLPAFAFAAFILVLPLSGCKNEQQTVADDNKPLTRKDLEEVLDGPKELTQEELEVMKDMKAKIAEQTKGYFD